MKYEAINKLSGKFTVAKMCEVLGVYPPNYYRWIKQEQKREEKRQNEICLVNKIEKVFLSSDRTDGYSAIKKELFEDHGIYVSEYKIRRIMCENGFYLVTTTKYKPAHNGKSDGKYYKNRLKQNFKTDKPNQVWAGDITYIKTNIGWVYLPVVLDLFNREVIGYAISKKINAELVMQALTNAVARHGKHEGLVFHSDRGCQYSSKKYQTLLADYGIKSSMSRPGCPYDNSCSESIFATLKKERIYRRNYLGVEDFRRDMFKYMEFFYNRKRRHSYLGYISPVTYRMKHATGMSA